MAQQFNPAQKKQNNEGEYEYQSELVGCSNCSERGALGILSVASVPTTAHRLLGLLEIIPFLLEL